MGGFCQKLLSGFGYYHSNKRFLTISVQVEGKNYCVFHDLETHQSAIHLLKLKQLSSIPEEEEEKVEQKVDDKKD